MEGLIPFLYKAMVMYKREGSFSSVFLSDHHSHQLPVTTGDFLATPPVYFERQSSGDLGPTVLDCLKRRLLHHLACPLWNITKRTDVKIRSTQIFQLF
ncbi:unnamed protein product [Brassica rapa]|uniref:Uncharacterized protein n=1 Tax=Brassica campestris TaxID=3711 RepID=A0A8D9GY37_BRACM|nr:unnamed protein product [Brassica rapa]